MTSPQSSETAPVREEDPAGAPAAEKTAAAKADLNTAETEQSESASSQSAAQSEKTENGAEAKAEAAETSAKEGEDAKDAPPPMQEGEDPEHYWFKHIYRGPGVPQLTWRAVIMGALIGGLMSLSNLYVGLKTGWGLGVAITACILSYSIWTTLHKVFPKIFKTQMSILENNCMQSCASSAGYSTGGTMVSAISAYLLLTGTHMTWGVLTLWTFFLATLGVFMAIPMKRQMINVEQLKFPSGVACAETLRSLHSHGAEAMKKARALGIAGLLGGAIAIIRDGLSWIPSLISFPGTLAKRALGTWTISFDLSGVMVAAGALVGWRVSWSMLLGGLICYGVLAPWMTEIGAIDGNLLGENGYRTIVGWSTWTGAAIMVASGLTMFAMEWKTMLRAFSGLANIFGKSSKTDDPMEAIEVPPLWFVIGTAVSGLACIIILHTVFDTTWWMGLIAVVATFFLALVACRATGESDITPVGAMGKITQLTFGLLAPSKMTTNLMTAGLTAGAAGASADLLTDLKSGYVLGANPRQQFLAQLSGVIAGTLVVVPAFYLIVPDASVLGSTAWPAPSAQVWAKVAELLKDGFSALHPTARLGMGIGCLIGILIPVLEKFFPKYKKFIPSATGLGLAMVIPFYNSLSMFIGACIATYLEKKHKQTADDYIVPVASGIIAGESLVGVAIALKMALPGILPTVKGAIKGLLSKFI
ncbi:OPT/YSL family transporter [bacterium]|nr:OPT/YSL family transporter [bacterium]